MTERAAAFLRLAHEELGAAERLVDAFPRQAAYQLHQAAEKIARAVLARSGIPFGTSHNLGQMAAALPLDHPWRPRLMAFDHLSPAATVYRYPSPTGRLKPPPEEAALRTDVQRLRTLLAEAEGLSRPPPSR
ncbi:MAG: HEPN domain-containing protein [Alphaproteobacteria bacterium]|nr:HEPN domain-containing protein [Alphaproteobacteria bacterium]